MSYHPTGTARFQAGASPNRLWLWLLARTGDPLARLLEPGFCGDAYGLYEQMRAQEPVYRSRTGMLAVLSYDRCSRVLHDPRFLAWGSSARPAGRRAPTPGETPAAVGPFEARTQENDHACTIAASLVKPALQPSVSRVEVTAHNLLSRAADGDAFDLIDDFALPWSLRASVKYWAFPMATQHVLPTCAPSWAARSAGGPQQDRPKNCTTRTRTWRHC
nr:hypothetical protein GCM10020093_020780 [Planobispora longispora]